MEDYTNNININININTTYDFIASIISLVENSSTELSAEYNLESDSYIEHWINEISENLANNYLEKIKFYFTKENLFGLGMVKFIYDLEKNMGAVDIPTFLENLEKINYLDLLNYLLLYSYDGEDLSGEMIKDWLEEGDLYEIIEENFKVDNNDKWAILEIFNNPVRAKEELLKLLREFYEKYYSKEEKRVKSFLNRYLAENREKINEGIIKGMEHYFSPGSDLIDYNEKLTVGITYFWEYSCTFFNDNFQLLGYKNHQYIDKLTVGQQDVEEQGEIFKVIGDQTRLKILLELNKGTKYMTELANKLDISAPTVDYHIKKFINVGLVQIDKAKNRIYYKLRKDRLRSAISILEDSFDL